MRRPLEYALCWSIVGVATVVCLATMLPKLLFEWSDRQGCEALRVLGELKKRERS